MRICHLLKSHRSFRKHCFYAPQAQFAQKNHALRANCHQNTTIFNIANLCKKISHQQFTHLINVKISQKKYSTIMMSHATPPLIFGQKSAESMLTDNIKQFPQLTYFIQLILLYFTRLPSHRCNDTCLKIMLCDKSNTIDIAINSI